MPKITHLGQAATTQPDSPVRISLTETWAAVLQFAGRHSRWFWPVLAALALTQLSRLTSCEKWPSLPFPSPAPSTVPSVTVPPPTPELQLLVQPVKQLAIKNPRAAKAFVPLYAAGAAVVRQDSSRLSAPSAARTAKLVAEKLFSENTAADEALPEMREAINQVLLTAIGTSEKEMDAPARARFADTLAAVAWALGT